MFNRLMRLNNTKAKGFWFVLARFEREWSLLHVGDWGYGKRERSFYNLLPCFKAHIDIHIVTRSGNLRS